MKPGLFGSLLFAQAREQPVRLATTLAAILLGVALASAIHTIGAGAASAFEKATRTLSGEADFVVRGPREGFDENLYARIARLPGVASANPAIETPIVAVVHGGSVTLIGLDTLRLPDFRPAMYGEMAGSLQRLFGEPGVFLTAGTAKLWGVKPGDSVEVHGNAGPRRVEVIGVLSERESVGERAYMDLGVLQWVFGMTGWLNRIDVRVKPGVDVAALGQQIRQWLPPGVTLDTPAIESARAAAATRAYRTNLGMLALVSVLTGAVLLMATQALSILRRRESLGLLRALGATKGDVERALVLEGAAIGLVGAMAGVVTGQILARWVLARGGADFGSGLWRVRVDGLNVDWPAMLAAVGLATLACALASWWPAREGAARPPAKSLRPGDAALDGTRFGSVRAGVTLCALGLLLVPLPAVQGLPLAGYAAIGAWLLGGMLLVPAIATRLLALLPDGGSAQFAIAVAQLRASVGLVSLGLAAMIVSFSLMVAMIVMVHSFRASFERWLDNSLPSDLVVRVAPGADGIVFTEEDLQRMAGHAGIRRLQFSRTMRVTADPARPPIVLIARDASPAELSSRLNIVARAPGAQGAGAATRAWMSEAVADARSWEPGGTYEVIVHGRPLALEMAGIYRDYGNPAGSVTITRDALIAATGDTRVNEVAVWVVEPAAAKAVIESIRAQPGVGPALQIRTSGEVRAQALRGFDRAFAITWALEIVAVVIGLLGVSFAATSTALARRAEFGVLRHLGMRRSSVQRMLVTEGLLTALIATSCALLLGLVISAILVHVVNRQSFHWSVDLAFPWGVLAGLAALLVASAGGTALVAARAAVGPDVVRAVKEDW